MMNSSHTILVTGATGFVGQHLCKALEGQGHKVRRIVRTGSKGPNTWVVEDLAATDIPDEALTSVDMLIHLAASIPGRQDDISGTKTADMAQRIAAKADEHSIARVILLSSIAARLSEDGDKSAREYGAQKLAAEGAFKTLLGPQTALVTLRPPVIYGHGARGSFGLLVRLVRTRVHLPLSQAVATRAYLSIENLCSLICRLADADDAQWNDANRKAFEPHDGKAIGTADLVRLIGAELDMRPRVFTLPQFVLRTIGGLTGKQDQVAALFDPLSCCDEPSLRTAFGWRANVHMPESLAFLKQH